MRLRRYRLSSGTTNGTRRMDARLATVYVDNIPQFAPAVDLLMV